MFMIIKLALILFITISCATPNMSRDVKLESQKICMSAVGKGRLHVKSKKYVFSFESLLEKENSNWNLILDFPLHNPETFELDWSGGKTKFTSSLEQKILNENKSINPQKLEAFIDGIGDVLKDIVALQENEDGEDSLNNIWSVDGRKLKAISENNQFLSIFTNPIGNSHFGLISVSYFDKLSLLYKMELVVRNCEL